MESKGTELERALAFMARVDEDAATEVREWSLGTALVTPELPRVWDASYFRAERAGAGPRPAPRPSTSPVKRDLPTARWS
jgi:hypothetical protein